MTAASLASQSGLEIIGLRKAFGGVVALSGVDLHMCIGEILGIVGPNGSGKTTLFNVITGALKPTDGQLLLDGEEIGGLPPYQIARRGIVRTFQQAMAFPGVTVEENVRIAWEHASAVGPVRKRWMSPRDLLDFVDLTHLRSAIAGNLPFGSLRKLGLAVALASNPKLLLLDEPAAGLNDTEIEQLAELSPAAAAPRHRRLRHRPRHGPDGDAVRPASRAQFRLQDRRGPASRGPEGSEGVGSLSGTEE